jgi:DNA-binding YbaB/EbfC family protein
MKSFGDMMKQAQKVQKQMAELQEKLAEERFEASAGGGLVKAVVDGKQMLKELKIGSGALKELSDGDMTLLEDLILTAVGEAQRSSEVRMNESLGKLTGGLKLPF